MIKILDDNSLIEFNKLSYNDPFWCKIKSLYNSYGLSMNNIDFWFQKIDGVITAIIAKNNYNAILYVESFADFIELREFLSVVGINYISLNRKYVDSFRFAEMRSGSIMVLRDIRDREDLPYKLCSPSAKKIVDFLIKTYKEDLIENCFNDMYVDLSHRIRHKGMEALAYCEEGNIISLAMIIAKTELTAVIGAVATDVEFRNKGLASFVIIKLIKEFISKNKTVYVFREYDKNKEFYSKLGFYDVGSWSEVKV